MKKKKKNFKNIDLAKFTKRSKNSFKRMRLNANNARNIQSRRLANLGNYSVQSKPKKSNKRLNTSKTYNIEYITKSLTKAIDEGYNISIMNADLSLWRWSTIRSGIIKETRTSI